MEFDYDFIVIGSGFGGSVSALRLSEKGYSVCVLEMGKRWTPNDFPKTNMSLRKFIWKPSLFMYGMQQLTLLKHAFIAHGCGVGGGSLIYANTLLVPPSHVFKDSRWPSKDDWEAKLSPHYEMAKRMLGAVEAKSLNATDEMLREVVSVDLGCGEQCFQKHTVSVFYGDKAGETVSDPFFSGEGPDCTGCIQCAECMSGCKRGSKNTLDRNYLYLAEKRGTKIMAERLATDIRALDGGGYEIDTECSTRKFRKDRHTLRCKGLVVSAGVLGTVKLLLECKERGSLPKLSDELGDYVRTNAEAFGVVTAYDRSADFSDGIAITSGVRASDGTHIEAVRWGKGHDFIGLQVTVLTGGGGAWPRWLRMLGNMIRRPHHVARMLWPFGWAKRSVVLMGMRTSNSYMRLKMRRGILGRSINSELVQGARFDPYMPVLHEVTERMAKKINGMPQSAIVEVLFNTCTTAHILGGATMGQSPEHGVCDEIGRVFGYDDMYICDGSLVPANLTVNPSLTITALSEHVMSHVAVKDGAKMRPVKLSSELAAQPQAALQS